MLVAARRAQQVGVACGAGYIAAASAIVSDVASDPSQLLAWPPDLVAAIRACAAASSTLGR